MWVGEGDLCVKRVREEEVCPQEELWGVCSNVGKLLLLMETREVEV